MKHLILSFSVSRNTAPNGYASIIIYLNRFNPSSSCQDFRGDCTVGHRIGGEPPSNLFTMPLSEERAATSDDEEEDDEENAQVTGLIDFVGSLTFT